MLGLECYFLICIHLLFNKKIIIIAPQALQTHHHPFSGGVWVKGELVWATCDLA
jgi:hypothetical protein